MPGAIENNSGNGEWDGFIKSRALTGLEGVRRHEKWLWGT